MGRHNSSRRGVLPTPEIRPDDPTLTRFAGAIPLIAFMTEELFVVVMTTQPIRHRESCFLDVTIIGIKP